MNNAARGVILAFGLLGMGLMFIVMVSSIDDGGTGQDFDLKDLANVLSAGLGMVSCAVVAGAALSGMAPPKPRTVAFPYQQQAQPYPQQSAVPQQGAVPQQYAPQQQYGQQPQAPQQPRQD
ncbi:hypothetical protein E1264_07460 [Actinomadura sp. KC216]|uniref:hypothetical protein n=1 Tax=Actinomadura sp. KC216 TaxID=2530370 RepID=UPI00104FD889|nr:hypothetical protein [Actinomadura sp. KC216]TDB89713.1 hypothetical protein E1264_07460 [Actinomadura sp. KC216]